MIKIEKKLEKVIFNKKIVKRSSVGPVSFPICMLWQRCRFGLDLKILILEGESHLGWVFSEIGTPSGLGVRREERERERESSWIVVWKPNFGMTWVWMRQRIQWWEFVINRFSKIDFSISRLHCIFKALSVMVS